MKIYLFFVAFFAGFFATFLTFFLGAMERGVKYKTNLIICFFLKNTIANEKSVDEAWVTE